MKVIKIGGGCLKDGQGAKAIIELIALRGKEDTFGDLYARLERYYFGISFTREATPRMREMIAYYTAFCV